MHKSRQMAENRIDIHYWGRGKHSRGKGKVRGGDKGGGLISFNMFYGLINLYNPVHLVTLAYNVPATVYKSSNPSPLSIFH